MKLIKTIEAYYVDEAQHNATVTLERLKKQIINIINVKTVLETTYKDEDGDKKGALIVMDNKNGLIVPHTVDFVLDYLND